VALHRNERRYLDLRDRPHYSSLRSAPPSYPAEPGSRVSQAATVESLPVLVREGIRLREVHLSYAAALTALFQLPEVAEHLDPPPTTIDAFGKWIALSQSRREEGRAACYTLLTGDNTVSGLFMALRFEDPDRAEIGFAMAPHLWGTGVFQKSIDVYLDFLFNDWGVKTLVGKTQVNNGRALGAMRKLGAIVIEQNVRNDKAEFVWTITR
jgi:RimJ/RimL family protein N-acetyltransferase